MKLLKPILRPFQTRLISHLLNNFSYWQSRGVHAVPVHFYQPIPDTRTLDPELWNRVADLPGLNLNENSQLQLLDTFVSNYKHEYEALPREKTVEPYQYFVNNGAFESVDGEILYCMIRHFRPRRIFEIGSGNSTYLSAQAALKNEAPCDLTAFEPYPNDVLQQGFPGLTALHRVQAQGIPLEKFAELDRNDILFIDSSHVLKIGSDVQYLYLEVIPRLRPGVVIHIHDIFLPAEYPRQWVMQQQTFWNEQYLLQAFLAFNDSFEVHWAGSYMHLKHPESLEAAFSSYDRRTRWPGSFWLSRKF
jgi:predicted O-methyltransferase YrrM